MDYKAFIFVGILLGITLLLVEDPKKSASTIFIIFTLMLIFRNKLKNK